MLEEANSRKNAEVIQWGQELDEIDHLAFAGKEVSNDEFLQIAQSLIDGTDRIKRLEKVRAKKQQLLNKVRELEEIERELEETIISHKNQ